MTPTSRHPVRSVRRVVFTAQVPHRDRREHAPLREAEIYPRRRELRGRPLVPLQQLAIRKLLLPPSARVFRLVRSALR